jgi:7-carboxy-7-deazaguanine synthase
VLAVSEVFFSIQGEGTRAGLPCVFVRLAGCPLRCVWCDTAYAFGGGRQVAEDQLFAEVGRFPCRRVELTGGEPLAQGGSWPFVARLLDAGYEVLVETSGHVSLRDRDPRAVVIMDLKPPGSGESHRMDWDNLGLLRHSDEVKFVIADRNDYLWSRDVVAREELAGRFAVLFAPAHGVLDAAELARWLLADGLDVRLQIQLHKVLWPGVERGV